MAPFSLEIINYLYNKQFYYNFLPQPARYININAASTKSLIVTFPINHNTDNHNSDYQITS